MKKLIGSISVALTLALSVFGLAACDLVNFNWGTGSDHEHHFTEYEATDPTCTKNGNYRYFKCDVGPDPCGRYYIDLAAMEPVSEESVMIPALGHEYDFDNIVWSEWNGKEITASVTCQREGCSDEEEGHVLHPEITVKFTQTKAPTCTAKGEGYYTASFTYEGETYTNPTTKTAEVDMIPHTYNKTPDDGWKWADDHTSVSATFTCTAADCTHKETVTVSGAAITSKVETIEGVCTDGSQTVYTATAEFNGETYDLTDTVVTRAAINEHKAGDWQYDATQHWHKCSVCGEDMDDKASHQPDSSTHKCECGYEEESYTVTAASINAADGKVVLTINGTCTGYTQETLAAAFKTFGFWGGSWTYPASEDFTLTLTEKAWTITVDVTKMTSGTYTVCLNDGGKGEFTVTDGMLGENATASTEKQTYTLQPNWENKLELVIAVEKTYAITAASIAAEGEAVYVTVSGTFAGYSAEEFLAALQDDKIGENELAFCIFYAGTGPQGQAWGRVINYDNSELITYTAKDNSFTVKFDVTDLEVNRYQVGKDNSNEADIKNLTFGLTDPIEMGKKAYQLQGTGGNVVLFINEIAEDAQTITGIKIETDDKDAYVVVEGSYTGYSDTNTLKAVLENTDNSNQSAFNINFFAPGGEGGTSNHDAPRTATINADAHTWSLKITVTDMIGGYTICWKGDGYGDIDLDATAAPDNTVECGEKTYSIKNKGFWSHVSLVIAQKTPQTEYSVTSLSLEADAENQKVYLVVKGTFSGYTQETLQNTVFNSETGDIYFWADNLGKIEHHSGATVTVEGSNYTAKLDVTALEAEQLRNICKKGAGSGENPNDWKASSEEINETPVVLGKATYTLQKSNGYGNVGLKVEREEDPAAPKYEVTAFTIEQQGEKVYLLYKGTSENYEPTALEAALRVLNTLRFDVHNASKGGATGAEGDDWAFSSKDDGTWEMKLEITVGSNTLFTADSTYFIDNLNSWTDGGRYYNLWNTELEVTLNGYVYKTGAPLTEPNTWNNVSFTITAVAPAKTAEFDIANLILFGGNQARVHIAIKSYTGFTEADLAKENVKLYVGEGEAIEPHTDSSVTSSRADYYFLVTGSSTGTLKLKIGDVELTNIASSVSTDEYKAFVNPNFYTLALNGDDLVLTVINAAEAFTLNGISLKNTEGTVNLTLTGTTTAADATAKLFLENYGYCYYKNGRQQFANKTVTVEDGAFTFTVDVTDLGAGSYTLLARDADGTDLKNGELVTDKEVQIENMKYSITTNGTVVLVIEDSAHACDYTSITLEKTAEDKVYLVLGGTYDGYSKEEVEALLKNTNPGENYSLGFYPNVIPAEDRTITVNDSEKTWTLKFEITDLNAGAHNFCIQMVGGGDAKGPAGFVQQTETVGDTTFTLQGGVGANISVKVEKKDPDAQTGTVAYTSVTLEPTAEKVYLVYRGTYTGFTAEYLKETVLKNTDTSKEDIPSFGFWHEGAFDDATPAEITVTEVGLTWEVKIDITGFSGEYSVLWRNIGGGDAKGPADFVAQSEAFNGNTYSLTGSVGGDIHLNVEEGIHGTYEVTSGSVELEGGKAYFSVNGTYKNYEEDGLKAALETVEFWFTRYGDYPEIGQGTSEKRTPFTTEPEISVDTEAKTWKVSVDVTNFENGTWIAKFPGDIKLAGSQDGQSVTVGDKTYSIFNKYPDGSEQPSIWGCTCLLVEDVLKENEINFGGESASTVHPGYMFYWNGDTEGTNATVTTKTAVDGVYTFQYTLTETAKGNAGLWHAVQLFYKNSELKENTVYTLTFQLKSSVTGKITVNGTVIDLTGNNQVQTVSVEYTQTAKASLSIQFGVDGNAPLEGGTFVISELKWQEKTSGPEEPPAEKKLVFAGLAFADRGQGTEVVVNINTALSTYTQSELAAAESFVLVFTPTEGAPIRVTCAVAGADGTAHHFPLATVTAGTYTVTLEFDGKTFECPAASGVEKTDSDPTYKFEIADGKLTLTVTAKGGEEPPAEKDPKITSANLAFDPNLLSFIFNTENCTQEILQGAKLLVNGEESSDIRLEQVAATGVENQFKAIYNIASLGEGTYTLVYQLNGTDYNFVDNLPGVYTYNNKTYTLANAEGKLQLTVAAVVPAADGSQDAPFSVSDLAAIFEDDSQFGTFSGQSYYTGGGSEPQKVYVGGYIKDVGSTNAHGFTKIVIEPTQAAAAGIALAANELNEILIYSANYNKIAGEGMTLKVGDYIVVYGYLEIFSGTTKEIANYNSEYPTIESFRSVTPEEDAEAAFQEINGKTFTVSSTLPLPTFTTRPGVTYKFEVQSEGSENLKINEQDGVFEVLKRSKEQDLTITVNVTISVAGQEGTKSTTITVTIPKDTGEEEITYEAESTVNGGDETIVALNEAIEITFSKGTNNSSKPKYYASGNADVVSELPAIRCYANNTITVSGKDGATILSVTIVFGVKKTDPAPLTETTTKQTVSSGTAFQVGEEGVGASSIEFQVSNVSKQQVHIASIKVTYKPGKTLSPDEKIDAALKEINIEKTEFNDDFVLPTTIVSGVTLTWSVEGGDGVAAKIDETNTKLLIVPQAAEVTFTLVVEASCNGGTPVSKKFENLKVSAKTAVKTYTLVTSEEQLKAGKQIVFVYDIYACGTFTKGATGSGPLTALDGVTLDNKELTSLPDETVVWTVGGEKNAWTFTCTINSIEYRLAQGSTSNATMKGETGSVTTASQWTITFNNDSSAEIRNNKNYSSSAKWVFQCNIVKNQQRWGTYKDTQKDPFIYLVNE